jgi:predicted negative regulator of RcsB-dependent stress response
VRTYERHQLKQDKFAATTKETISWAVEHRTKLVAACIVVAVVVIVVAGGTWIWSYRNQQANSAFGKALSIYNAPLVTGGNPAPSELVSFPSSKERARVAHNEFQKVADQYGMTKAGKTARYMAAVTALEMGDSKAGEQELRAVADSGDKDLASLAKLALAGVYRDTNRNSEALQIYKDLIEHPTASVSKATAQLQLASLYEATNQSSEAGKLYSEIMKDDPRSYAASVANQHLSAMKQ